jgi:hypothetical protein
VSFIEGLARGQVSLLPPCVDDYVEPDAIVRVVDAFVASLNLAELGFGRTMAAATGRRGESEAKLPRAEFGQALAPLASVSVRNWAARPMLSHCRAQLKARPYVERRADRALRL